MADDEQLSTSLQESLLTALCFDNTRAAALAGIVNANHFEEPYRDIAARALEYRARYGKAPGKEHLDDLFDHVLEDPKNKKAGTYRRLLMAMVEQSKGLNVAYVADRVTEFVRRQTLKGGVLLAAQRYQQGGDSVADDVERILFDALKVHVNNMDAGVRLTDNDRAFSFLDINSDIIKTGIPELDVLGFGPTRKEMGLLIGPRGKGKSWWLVHLGRQGLLQRYKVLYISLELSEERVAQRFFQNLFSIAKRDEDYRQTLFEFDELRRLSGFSFETLRPRLHLSDPKIRRKLAKLTGEWGARLNGLLIKSFPTKSLTVPKFESYLDTIEQVHRFVPDLVLFDYPDLCWTDPKNPRTSIGRVFEDLRGVGVARNMAMEVVTQSTRLGHQVSKITAVHVAEDISKIATSDRVLTYNQTDDEHSLGLARLYVDKARNDQDKYSVLISQNYTVGQFMLNSCRMGIRYFDQLQAAVGRELSDDQEEQEDD